MHKTYASVYAYITTCTLIQYTIVLKYKYLPMNFKSYQMHVKRLPFEKDNI